MARVVDHIPEPSQQTVRYWDYYANAARGKRRKAEQAGDTAHAPPVDGTPENRIPTPLSADGSDRRRLTDDEEGDRYLSVGPDGEILVITRGELSRDAVLIENFL